MLKYLLNLFSQHKNFPNSKAGSRLFTGTIKSQNAAVLIVKGFFAERACTREGCEELLPHLPYVQTFEAGASKAA
jgi:hypothetical protein